MKTLINYSLIFISVLFFALSACKKDDNKPDNCAQIVCQNGGTCNNGSCLCPTGFSGDNCEIKNINPPTFSINSSTQIYFLLNGNEVKITNSGENEEVHGSDKSLSTIDSSTAKYSCGIFKEDGPQKSVFDLTIGTLSFIGSKPSNNHFKSLFETGSKSFTIDGEHGVSLMYRDADGKMWSTSLGNADQAGSTFTIKENKFSNNVLSQYQAKIWAEFNCKLYDDNGASKTVTNGTVIVTLINQ